MCIVACVFLYKFLCMCVLIDVSMCDRNIDAIIYQTRTNESTYPLKMQLVILAHTTTTTTIIIPLVTFLPLIKCYQGNILHTVEYNSTNIATNNNN